MSEGGKNLAQELNTDAQINKEKKESNPKNINYYDLFKTNILY